MRPEPDPQIGRTIADKFRLEKLIGEGGMGKVYQARHLTLEKDVCIKMLRPGLLEDETVVGRFAREAKAVSRLRNAHTIQILDFGQDERGGLFIVMELVSGRNLQQTFVEEYPFSEERVCHITEQVLSALTEAHAQHVIHRDLKPENIMVEQRRGEPDFVKVLDFGIAKIQESDFADITRADMVCGTPAYMSPEQGSGGTVDARSDLYAVGVIMYQLVTGVVPFDGVNSVEVLTKHQVELPIPPNIRKPEHAVSADLEQLILRALEKDPRRRIQTAESFREKILRIAERLRTEREKTLDVVPVPQPTQASKPAPHSRLPSRSPVPRQGSSIQEVQTNEVEDVQLEEEIARSARARRRALLIGAGAVLVALAAIVLLPLWAPKAPAPRPRARPQVEAPSAAAPPPAAPASPVAAPPAAPAAAPPSELGKVRVAVAKIHVRPRNPTEAKRLVDEEGDPAYYEENFKEAERFYRQAIRADSRYAAAYKGLFKAGVGAADRRAIREGGRGYLKLNPEADDAEVIRETLRRF